MTDLRIIQVNRWGDCVVLNPQGGEVWGDKGRRPLTRAEAEQIKAQADGRNSDA